METSINKGIMKIALVIMLITGGLAVFVYNMPFASSASAYDVSLTADDASKEVAAGQQVSYLLTITNEGNNGDRYTITSNVSKSPSTWTVQLSQTSTGNIGSGSTTTFTVTVRAPSTGVDISSYCYATIKVTSQGDPTNSSASVLLSTQLKRTYGVSISSPGLKNLDPGKSVTYSFKVKNEGNDKDGYSLEAITVPSGWSASIDFDTGKIDPGTTKNATMTVQAPSNAKAQSYQFVVKASSVTDNTTSATRTITANVNQTYKVSISSEGVKEVDITSQRVVNFNVKVTNLGNGEDQFDLEYYVPSAYTAKGWGADISTTTTSKIAADGSVNVTFFAYTPSKSYSPPVNSKGEFYINATSVGDSSVTQQVKVSCVVKPYYDLTVLNTGPSSKTVDPDGSVIYTFKVTNKGNDEDDFDLGLSYPRGFQDSSIEPSSLTLASGASSLVNVTLNPDSDVVKAQSYRLRLYVNSTHGVSKHSDFFAVVNKQYGAFLDAPNGAIIASGQPGQTYKMQVRLQNKGNGADSFDLSVEGETSSVETEWSPLVSAATTPLLESDEYYYFNLTVSAPSNATQGTYRFQINASSTNSNVFKTIWLSVRIPQIYNIDISANKQSIKGQFSNDSGTMNTVSFTLDVYNRGSGQDDSISVKVKEAPSSFAGLYSVYFTANDRSKITIDSDSSETASLDIEMPRIGSGLPAGTYFFVVEASSDNGTISDTSDDKIASINLSLVLEPVHRVKILSGVNSSQVNIGSSVTFSVIIQNRGTTSDYYQISLEHPNYGPNVDWSIPNSNLTTKVLQPLEQETIILTATIKTGADPDWGSVWVKVTATHSTDLTIKDEKYFTAVFADKFAGDLSTDDNYEQAAPGESAAFNVSIENWGTRSTDTFRIEIRDEFEFEDIIVSPSSLTLAPYQKSYISISVSVPSIEDKIIPTGTYELVFEAISDGETTQKLDDVTIDNITLKIKVMPVARIQFLVPLGSAEVEPGKTLSNVELNVTNKGNEPTTMNVKVDTSTPSKYRSWVTISPSTLSDLDPNQAASVYASIKAPSSAEAETFTIYFNVSTTDDKAFTITPFDVTVKEDYSVDLRVPNSVTKKDAEPGQTVNFEVLLKNTGNAIDGFELTLTSAKADWVEEWGVGSALDKVVDDVGIDVTKTMTVKIAVAENAPAGDQTFTIKATSKGDEAVSDSITLTVSVEPRRDVELNCAEQTKEVVPDVDLEYTEVEYDVQVINKGESSDTFKVQVLDNSVSKPKAVDSATWSNITKTDHNFKVVLSKTVTNSIPKNGQETITITVQVPKDHYEPATHKTVIWAYSEGDTDADDKYSDILILQTKVKQAYGANVLGDDYIKTKEDTDTNKLYAVFTSRVENSGTGVDDFKIEVDETSLPDDFDIYFSTDMGATYSVSAPAMTNVGAGDEASVLIKVEAPIDTLTGRYNFRLRWLSRGDDSEWNAEKDYVTSWKEMTIEVDQVYGVSIDPNTEEQDVEVGNTIQFKLTLENLGNDDDTFRMEVKEMDDTDNWPSLSKTKVTLDAQGKSANDKLEITLTIRVPKDNEKAIAGNYRFNISVTRDSSNRFEREKAKDFTIVSVNVKEKYSHDLSSDDDLKDADVGERVSYRFKVINKGNSRDNYELKVKGERKEWAELSTYFLTLDPEEEVYVYLNVTVPLLEQDPFDTSFPYVNDPKDVEAGRYAFDVEVQSRGDKDSDPVTLTFTVDVQQEFRVFIAEVEEGDSLPNAKIWDVNNKREDLKIRFTIENQGNKDDTFYIKKYTAPTGWDILVVPDHPRVPLGEQREITVTITFSQTSGFEDGTKSLKFDVWPDDGSVSGRNAKQTVLLYVNAQVPELEITQIDVPKGSDLSKGNPVDIKVTVRNSGMADAEDVAVSVKIGGETITTESQDIRNGSEKVFKVKWTPKSTGDFTIEASIEGNLIELDEDNNEKDIERSISAFNLKNYLSYGTLMIILIVLAVIALIIIIGLAYNRNKEIRELEALVDKLKAEGGAGRGGPRKVIKEAAGAPMPPKSAAGLPSAPGALAPAPTGGKLQKETQGKKEAVKVKCPQCKTQQVVHIDKRPAEVPCKECGVTLLIPEKK